MGLYLNPQLCSYLAVSYGADYCISIFTSGGNFNFVCRYEDLPMSLIKHYLLIL